MKKILILILLIIILLNIVNNNNIEKLTNESNNLYKISYNTLFNCENIYNDLKEQLNEKFNSNKLNNTIKKLEVLDHALEVKCKSLEKFRNGCLEEQTIEMPEIESPYAVSEDNI